MVANADSVDPGLDLAFEILAAFGKIRNDVSDDDERNPATASDVDRDGSSLRGNETPDGEEEVPGAREKGTLSTSIPL